MDHIDSDQVPILMYGNILVNSETKLEMLIFTFPLWVSYWKCTGVFRFRGKYADEAAKFVASFPAAVSHVGSNFSQWRRQAAFDIENMNCTYVFQYLEDHMPTPFSGESSVILEDLDRMHVDVLQYSWFQTYAPLVTNMRNHGADVKEALISLKIDTGLLETKSFDTSLYYISLTSIFRKSLYTKILRSRRPVVRRYDPRAPFDVEQKPWATWYLPLQYALTSSELGICLDDDHLVVGSSATSRGLYAGSGEQREITHHARWSLRNSVLASISTLLESNFSGKMVKLSIKGISGISTVFDTTFYSLSALVLNVRDSKIESSIRGRKARDT